MMKIKKERKPFKREYIPIVLAVLILFLLIGALIYLIGHDFKFEEETVNPDQPVQEEILIDNSNSKCSKEELNELYKLAEKITTDSEMVEVFVGMSENDSTGEEVKLYGYASQFTLKDVDSKLYAHVTNDYNDDEKDYNVEDEKIVFQGTPSFDIVTYTVEIKSNDYGCKGETIRKFTLRTKIFNRFFNMIECDEFPDFKYCQQYIDEDLPTLQMFKSELAKYKKTTKKVTTESDNKEVNKNDNKETKSNYKLYIIIAIIVILVGVVAIVTLILVKKKRSKRA